MNYFQRLKTSSLKGLAKHATPFMFSIGIVTVLSACSVSNPQGPQPVFQNTDETKNLFTLDLLEGDTQTALEEEYGAEVLVWKPEAGFAILGSAKDRDLLPLSLEVDDNQNSIKMPVTALSSGWMSGTSGWALSDHGWASGDSGFASGDSGFALGDNGFISGDSGWQLGVNSAYLKKNSSYWQQIDLFGAHYSSATLGKGVKIAVIDTGIDVNHPMFTDNLAPKSEWRDYVDYDYMPQDKLGGSGSGHGTAVAGIILQVAPQATILPIRVLDQDGFGDMDHVIYAIDHAVESGANIINLSLGSDSNSKSLRQMLLYAKSKGVFTVAAAGNTGVDNTLLYPARMSSWQNFKGSIFAVGSVSSNDSISAFSTARNHNIAFAPGEGIRTTFPGNRLADVTGTSFAAPLFAGSLALAFSELDTTTEKQDLISYVKSGLERERIENTLYATSMPWRHGNGVLNVNALVNATKLTNPSFETSSLLNHWNNFNASATTIFKNKTYQRSGSQIAHLTPDGYLRKTVKGLKPNTTYQVKMLVGFDNYQGKANIRISNYSNVGSPIYRAFTGSGRTNNLSYIHTTFTTGSANTSAFLQIKNRSTTGTANFYVDEIRLKALSVEGK